MIRALVVALLVVSACSSGEKSSTKLTDAEAQKLLIDRNWLDRMPDTERERLHVYRFVPNMGGGVFQDRTLYKGTFELFSFSATAGDITFDLHETREKITAPFSIEKVTGPAPFDLRLTIDGDPRGPGVYYGIRAETDKTLGGLDQQLRALAK